LDFSNNIQKDGALVACADDPDTKLMLKDYENKVISYGFSKNADYFIDKVSIEPERVFFGLIRKTQFLGRILFECYRKT